MTDHEAAVILWLLGTVEVVGLASAWFARLSQGRRHQAFCQCLFVACLIVVGAGTVVSLGLGPACWIGSGVTLSLMVLTVTCDFSHCRPAAAW